MHNLAIALHKKGYLVSGSDDEIFEPSRSRLNKYGLLPASTGWNQSAITSDIDTIILGMHAREDNPELIRAKELEITIKSFPEFLYEQTKNKKRIVVGGSHGKTTITSMIMHVLSSCNIHFDYMVGSIIEGFETMVGLSEDAEIAVFEGDEYLTSALDRRPKFHLYNPDIAIISGIEWDHINVFPEYETYVEQFSIFRDKIMPDGKLIYFEGDDKVRKIAVKSRTDICRRPYKAHNYTKDEAGFKLETGNFSVPLQIFGEHNMQNISAAKEACISIGITEEQFYSAISDFGGSAKRLQLIKSNSKKALYLDFAHAPSKVKATVEAIAQRYPGHKKVCCLELHTFSSLTRNFLVHYRAALKESDIGFIYFNPHAIKMKRLEQLSLDDIASEFGEGVSEVFDNSDRLFEALRDINDDRIVYLFMSSGDFNGTMFPELADELIR